MTGRVVGKEVPLLVILIGKMDDVSPVLQPSSLAGVTQNQRPEKIVTLANVLVPHCENERLLVQVLWSRLEEEFLVEHRVKIPPFDARLEFLAIRIGAQLAVNEKRVSIASTSNQITRLHLHERIG